MKKAKALLLGVCVSMLVSGVANADGFDAFLLEGSSVASSPEQINIGSPAEPWVDNTEARVKLEHENRGENTETYSFRFRPRFSKEQNAARSVYTLRRDQLLYNEEETLSESLFERYTDLIELVELRTHSDLLAKRIKLIQAETDLLQSEKVPPDQLQKVVLRLVSAQSELEFTKYRLAAMNARLNGKETVSLGQIISPAGIIGLLREKKATLIAGQNALQKRKAELALAMASSQLDLEKAQKALGISTVELSYDNKTNDSKALMFGVNIPFGVKSDPTVRDRMADVYEAQTDLQRVQKTLDSNLQEKIEVLQSLATYWEAQKKLHQTLDAGFDRLEDTNEAALVLTLNQQKLSVDESMIEIHFRMLRDYLSLLHMSGVLSEMPLRNWLRPKTPVMVTADVR
ncbi:MAG: hypothetical protein KDI13_08260 [Alphaproteobacteria bacterium]|nr:hypothetical protein [Alphaproteobacteria bacterium]